MASPSSSIFRRIFIVSSGNFLEMYDFMVYGYYASAIAKAYFPANSSFASLMASLAAFGAGFLMRPIGAIVLSTAGGFGVQQLRMRREDNALAGFAQA